MKWKLKEFNELTTQELYNILYLRAEIFVVEQDCSYQDLDFKDQHSYHLFLEKDNKVLAYIRIIKKGISYDEISIGRVCVSITNRNQGLARKIMEKGIDFIFTILKEDTIKISAQEYLLNFYESLGFIKISDTYLEDGIPHIKMLLEK
ncbi:MAG: GNAT family N-acetyltransferase [Clostridium sp.]